MRTMLMMVAPLALATACGSTKHVTFDVLEDATLVPASRPLPAAYTIGGTAAVAKACDEDGPIQVQALLTQAQGQADALAQVTIQRSLEQHWAIQKSMYGATSAPVLEQETVCVEVAGYPIDFTAPMSVPPAAPAP